MHDISWKSLRVVVLEDEILIALDLEQFFRDLGVTELVVASNLADIDAEASFDIAVLDIMLAGRSTIEFASTLFAKGVPLVFATGRSDAAQLLADLPGVQIVDKPFSSEALVQAVVSALKLDRNLAAKLDGGPDCH